MPAGVFCTKLRGFTLVEVLFVLAIIGILGTVTFTMYTSAREKSHDAQRISDLEQIRLSLRLYRDGDSTGSYPSFPNGVVIGEGGALDSVLAQYVGGDIRDPLSSVDDTIYEYVYDSDFDCAIAGAGKVVLYARTVERGTTENWSSICGTAVPNSEATYGIIIK